MPKEIITRHAADNVYLHKDFHGALSTGIAYLEQRHGAEAVRGYLRQFASAFYAGVTQAINERGLIALREHLERIYALEGGQPYHDYCGHCDLLYRRVLEPLGYEYTYDMSQVDHARCRLVVRRQP